MHRGSTQPTTEKRRKLLLGHQQIWPGPMTPHHNGHRTGRPLAVAEWLRCCCSVCAGRFWRREVCAGSACGCRAVSISISVRYVQKAVQMHEVAIAWQHRTEGHGEMGAQVCYGGSISAGFLISAYKAWHAPAQQRASVWAAVWIISSDRHLGASVQWAPARPGILVDVRDPI